MSALLRIPQWNVPIEPMDTKNGNYLTRTLQARAYSHYSEKEDCWFESQDVGFHHWGSKGSNLWTSMWKFHGECDGLVQ